jgi:ribonuclease BN (tRNA processing enzyme)
VNIKFVGTGSGKTSLKRFYSSLLFKVEDYNLLIDCGDGISKALLEQEIHFNQINGILISHLHPDHFSGLFTLLVQMKLNERKEELDLFIHEAIIEQVKKSILQFYIFIERINFDIVFNAFGDEETIKIKSNFSFLSRQNSHLEKYKAYDNEYKLKFNSSSFLFKHDDKLVFYTADIGKEKDLFLFEENHFHVMITEISHIGLGEVLSAFKKMSPEKLILTHISDDEEHLIDELFVKLKVPNFERIFKAYDGMILTI